MARLKTNVRTLLYIDSLEKRKRKYQELAVTDGLTKLFNHSFIHQLLNEEILGAQVTNTSLSIVMVDIDKFKIINDTYGHQTGDIVLKEIAAILRDSIRKGDSVGRYGGEEFLILLPGMELQEAVKTAERILSKVRELKFPQKDLKTTFSAGVVEYQGEEAEVLTEKSDKLLYQAKKNGRNRIETVIKNSNS